MPAGAHSGTAQRILFPADGDEGTLPLYVRADPALIRWSRGRATLPAGATASFATYFSAFPAGYWRAHTSVDRVRLEFLINGAAIARVSVLEGDAAPRVVESIAVIDGRVSIDIPLSAECSWVWFDIEVGDGGATVSDASWEVDPITMATTTVCITTHNREADCVRLLERLSESGETLELVERIFVVDQGDAPIRAHPDFAAVEERLGERLRVIEQPNLGGSGGFSRGMIESLGEDASHALLLDDDVLLEPESIRRMLAFAARARTETIVGAQMLSLTDRTLLHSYGERVNRRGFWWGPVDKTLSSLDLAAATIPGTPGLRAVLDVDFNGWWMCLLPAAVIRRLGAALPYFIKWDDAEFGLRAAADAVPTVTLPGAAIWHMPWTGKDDGLDWQAYFQLRNRIVTALLHSGRRRGGGVLGGSLAQDANHVMCMQYGSAAARRLALRDVLEGPAHLPATSFRRVADVSALMARAGQVVIDDGDLPASRVREGVAAPEGVPALFRRALGVAWHQARPARRAHDAIVDRALRRESGKWWSLGALDSATVTSATGRGAFIARRDRGVAIALLRDAVWLRMRLWARWPGLVRAYRYAAPELASSSAWQRIFGVPSPADGENGPGGGPLSAR